MKKNGILLSVVIGFAVLAVTITGVWLFGIFTATDMSEDFSFMYVEPINRLLTMTEKDAAFTKYGNSGVLYLDITGVTQTDCRYLMTQADYYAAQYGLSVDSCTREEAAAKGYIQFDASDKEAMPDVKNCIWIIVNDRLTDTGAVDAEFCLYAGTRGAYFCDMTLVKEDAHWTVTDMSGGLS